MNVTELLQYTRDLLAGEGDTDTWSDAQLLRFINQSVSFLHARKLESDPDVFVELGLFSELGITFTKRNNIWEGRIPDYVVRIRHIEYVENEGATTIQVTNLNRYRTGYLWSSYADETADSEWFLAGDRRLCVTAEPDTSKLRMWYVRRPAPLTRFEANSGTTSAVTLDVNSLGTSALGTVSRVPGFYVGSWLQVVSAGDAEPQGEVARVTGYTKATYPKFSMALDATLSAAVDSGDTVELLPNQLDEFHHELVAYMAAIRALDREGNIEHKRALQETSRDLWQMFLQTAEARQDQEPRHVSYTARGDT